MALTKKITDLKNPVRLNPGRGVAQQQDGFSVGETIKNVPRSAKDFALGVKDVLTHPLASGKALLQTVAGGVEKLVPGTQADEGHFDALVGFYKERYGSLDKFLNTLQEDPVGVATDASMFLTGAGSALKATGAASKASALGKTGAIVSKAGAFSNPLEMTGRVISPMARATFPRISAALERQSLRMTPLERSNMGKKLDEVTDFISRNGILGSPEQRFDGAVKLANAYEDSLDSFFNSLSKGSTVPRASVINGLRLLKDKWVGHRDAPTASKQIDGALKAVERMPSQIPYRMLNRFKRTTYENAFNRAGTKVLDDVEYAIGDATRSMIEQGLTGLKVPFGKQTLDISAFNQQYGLLLEAKRLLHAAKGRPQSSKLVDMLLGTAIGTSLNPGIGSAAGAYIGATSGNAIPITAIRARASSLLKNGQVPRPLKASPQVTTAAQRVNESRK